MTSPNPFLYYLSAAVAILGTVGYHHLLKKIPESVDPIVSIMAIYIGVLVLGALAAPFLYSGGQIASAVTQLGWLQVGIAFCILLMELGFLLMYRSGWNLSTGNVVTGVTINLALMAIGIWVFREKLSLINVVGIFLCIGGVAMISYRGLDKSDDKGVPQIIGASSALEKALP